MHIIWVILQKLWILTWHFCYYWIFFFFLLRCVVTREYSTSLQSRSVKIWRLTTFVYKDRYLYVSSKPGTFNFTFIFEERKFYFPFSAFHFLFFTFRFHLQFTIFFQLSTFNLPISTSWKIKIKKSHSGCTKMKKLKNNKNHGKILNRRDGKKILR